MIGEGFMIGALARLLQPIANLFGSDFAKSLVSNVHILVLGPERAGKTTFLNYLHDQLIVPAHDTDQTIEPGPRQHLVVRVRGEVILRFWKYIDTPGLNPIFHLQYIERYKPHCLVIILDASTPLNGKVTDSSASWFAEFSERLSVRLNHSYKVARNLRSVSIFLNKWDKVSEGEGQRFETAINEMIKKNLRCLSDCGARTGTVHVSRCSLVRSNAGDTLIKRALWKISRDFMK